MDYKRVGLWTGAIVLLLGMVWRLAKLASSPTGSVSNISLSEPVTGTDHTKGNQMARVVLVEYSDFECPACALFQPVSKSLMENYGNQVLFVFRHYPLPQHEYGMIAAKASEAAGKQGKFWEMHDMLFENQNAWSGVDEPQKIFEGYATTLGLDLNTFRSDLNSSEITARVERDIESGSRSGVDGTPSFYLNGKKITNLQRYGDLEILIQNALAEK